MTSLALDPGFGNVKLYGASGSVVMQSQFPLVEDSKQVA